MDSEIKRKATTSAAISQCYLDGLRSAMRRGLEIRAQILELEIKLIINGK